MAGEIIKAKTLQEGLNQLQDIYKSQSTFFKEISKEEYESYDYSEREDSDNHLNLERLGKDTDVVDLAYYKFLPDHKRAFRIELIHVDGISRLENFFVLRYKPGI